MAGSQISPDVLTARQEADAAFHDRLPLHSIFHWEERTIDGTGGPIPLRLYWPDDRTGHPILLYFHGGGFVLHNLASHDSLCRKLATDLDCIVVSVGYRLAPEHPYPAAPEDCYAALVWASAHAGGLGGESHRLLVAGDSAGATLSAAVCLMARDRQGPAIAAQLLFYGVFNAIPPECSDSVRELGDGRHILTLDSMLWFERQYLRDCPPGTRQRPTCFPGYADDLAGLPPALVVTGALDPLRDDGEAFARRLEAAGNRVFLRRLEGMLHGFLLCWHQYDSVRQAMDGLYPIIRQLMC